MMEKMCEMRGWGYVRLDGGTAIKKRQQLVDKLGDRSAGNDTFVFLLSSKVWRAVAYLLGCLFCCIGQRV